MGELIRRLKAAGFVEQRHGKGSHRQFVHPDSGRVITVAVHTKNAPHGTRAAHSQGGGIMTQYFPIVVE